VSYRLRDIHVCLAGATSARPFRRYRQVEFRGGPKANTAGIVLAVQALDAATALPDYMTRTTQLLLLLSPTHLCAPNDTACRGANVAEI
jgi:hypothetical protein